VNPGQKFRAGCYTIEGLNSFATVIYFNYLYFLFHDRFGFDNKQNLALAALIGLIYTFASWQAGRFAQRYGNFTALKIGFSIMAVGLVIGSQLGCVTGQIVIACVVNTGMCFIWPVLEALVSEGTGAAQAVGIYNITWAVNNALAYFVGGAIIQHFGYQSIFYVPLAFILVQLAMVFWIEKIQVNHVASALEKDLPPEPHRPSPRKARAFQQMAWLANPFAYIAINTLIAVMPGIAHRFDLSPMMVGFVCSLWCFARVITFIGLWQWTRWHYRFRWLATAFALLILSFAAVLSTHSLALLLVAQVFFGLAIGLIYYSSLFYSMDASDTKSEHGGIHEAAIGIGNCAGPLVGAASLQFFPQYTHNGVMAVSVLLLGGFGGMIGIWKKAK
jgi:predicted MFS family arabinose efflux permease